MNSGGAGGGGGGTFMLNVSKNGSGTVTSNPTGIDCGSTCGFSFTSGTSVTLNASAGSGSTFGGWSGEGCSGTTACTVMMSQARNVTATFNTSGSSNPIGNSIIPLGATRGQQNINLTINGSNLDGVTDIQFFSGSTQDTGISVSSVVPTGGTSVTATVNVALGAITGSHQVRLLKGSSSFNIGTGFTIYDVGAPAVYGISPSQVDMGVPVNFTITGANLSSVLSVSLIGGNVVDAGVTLNFTGPTANQIVGTLSASNTARVGPHNLMLNVSNNSISTNATVTVRTGGGTTINGFSTSTLSRGATSGSFNVNGTTLSAATGVRFAFPDGSIDSGITTVMGTPTGTSIPTTISSVGANIAIGPRRVVVDMPGPVALISAGTISINTAASGGIGVTSVTPSTAGPGFTGFGFNVSGSGLSTAVGFKFKREGEDDNSITLGTFTPGSNSISAPASVASTAPLGTRTVVLLLSGGVELPTTLTMNIISGGGGAGGSGGTATNLEFMQAPNSVVAGASFGNVQVAVETSSGSPVTTATNAITIALGPGSPSGATLSGTTTVNAVNGLATFNNLSINNAGVGYTLVASATNLMGATAGPFTVTGPSSTPTLGIQLTGEGTGHVSMSTSGFTCFDGLCNATFTPGTVVTLNPLARGNSTFAGFSGGSCSGTAACQVTMDAVKYVEARFDPAGANASGDNFLIMAKVGTGTGAVTASGTGFNSFSCDGGCAAGSGVFAPNATVTLTPVADAGSVFAGWEGDPSVNPCTVAGPCQFTFSSTLDFALPMARFTLNSGATPPSNYFLGLGVESDGHRGHVTYSNPSSVTCVGGGCVSGYPSNANTPVTLTAHPAQGVVFEGFFFAPTGPSCAMGALTCVVTMDQNRFIFASFASGSSGGGGGSSAPTLTSCSPSSGIHGSTGPATCTGTNFVVGATTLAFTGTGVIINSVNATSTTQLEAHWTLGGSLGTRGIYVTTAAGSSNTINFNVTADNISGATSFVAVTTSGAAAVTGSANGPANTATYNAPWGVWGDGPHLYIADNGNGAVRKLGFATGQVSTLTMGIPGPRAVWANKYKVYIADAAVGGKILEYNIATAAVTTLAGSGAPGNVDGVGVAAEFNGVSAIWGDGPHLYVADTLNHTIRKIVLATRVVTTIAGAAGVSGNNDGVGTAARFNFPMGLTGDGNFLYISDGSNHTIRKMDLASGVVTRIGGQVGVAGAVDGPVSSSRFNAPRGMWTDGSAYLYIVDSGSHSLRRLTIAGAVASTVALPPGTLNVPLGIWSDGQVIYVSNAGNHTLSKISPN